MEMFLWNFFTSCWKICQSWTFEKFLSANWWNWMFKIHYTCMTTNAFSAILALRFIKKKNMKTLVFVCIILFHWPWKCSGKRPKAHFQNDDALCLKMSFQRKLLKYKQVAFFHANQLMFIKIVLHKDSVFKWSYRNQQLRNGLLSTSIFFHSIFQTQVDGTTFLHPYWVDTFVTTNLHFSQNTRIVLA